MNFNGKPYLNKDGIKYEFIESSTDRLVLQKKRDLLKKDRKVTIMSKDDLYYLYAQIKSHPTLSEGDTVTIVVKTPVATTEENGKVGKITKDKIYIEGLDIPFEKSTGKKAERFFGTKVYIKELAN